MPRDVVGHRRGKHEEPLGPILHDGPVYCFFQVAVAEIASGQRRAAEDARQTTQFRAQRDKRPPGDAGADLFELWNELRVLGIIDKAGEVDPITRGEMAQEVPGADLVPFVGWVRDAV